MSSRAALRWGGWIGQALVCWAMVLPAWAASARSAAEWVAEMQWAAQARSYVGSVMQQRGAVLHSSRISQRVEGEASWQKVQMLDGKPMEFVRKRAPGVDEVRVYLPQQRRVLIERRLAETRFPSVIGAPVKELARNYEFRLGPEERAAGMRAQVVELVPRDGLRHGYRLWADQSTGLPLRVMVLDGSKVVEQVGFSELQYVQPAAAEVAPSGLSSDWTVETPVLDTLDPAKLGWSVAPPPGFVLKSAMRRRLPDGAPVIQLFMSDGLAHVSVFIEEGKHLREEGVLGRGAVSVAVRQVGSARVTAVGEVTAAGARAAAQSVEMRGRPAALQGGSKP